jgi:hypothetical protein
VIRVERQTRRALSWLRRKSTDCWYEDLPHDIQQDKIDRGDYLEWIDWFIAGTVSMPLESVNIACVDVSTSQGGYHVAKDILQDMLEGVDRFLRYSKQPQAQPKTTSVDVKSARRTCNTSVHLIVVPISQRSGFSSKRHSDMVQAGNAHTISSASREEQRNAPLPDEMT